jgi:AraC-like DNA-binding protein
MDAVPDHFDSPLDSAEFKRTARDGVELYRARIVRHAFDPHLHDAFGLGAIEAGVERFAYRGSEHLAPAGSLVLMNPGVLHTGRAETPEGWRYRMVYLDEALVEEATGERGWHFREPTAHDPQRAAQLGRLLQRLWHAPDALAGDSALVDLLDLLRAHATIGRPERDGGADAALARALALMHDDYASELNLERLAAEAGLSPFHFLRRFKRQYHVTPHQMLMAVRLARAKQHLAAGMRPAEVAAAVGLVDQAHLTRRFARMHGVTPARYQAQVRTRPAARA